MERLNKEGFEYIVSPYEADAQLAYFARNGYVHAVVTEDSDLICYGCPRVITKLDLKTGKAKEIRYKDVFTLQNPRLDQFNDDMFRSMCILAGCDYIKSIPKIGIKNAYKLMKKHKNIEKVIEFLRLDNKFKANVPQDYENQTKRALMTFQHQRVFNHIESKLVHLNPLPLNVLKEHLGLDELELNDASLVGTSFHIEDLFFLGHHLSHSQALSIASGQINPKTLTAWPSVNSILDGSLRRSMSLNSSSTKKKKSLEPLKGQKTLDQFLFKKKETNSNSNLKNNNNINNNQKIENNNKLNKSENSLLNNKISPPLNHKKNVSLHLGSSSHFFNKNNASENEDSPLSTFSTSSSSKKEKKTKLKKKVEKEIEENDDFDDVVTPRRSLSFNDSFNSPSPINLSFPFFTEKKLDRKLNFFENQDVKNYEKKILKIEENNSSLNNSSNSSFLDSPIEEKSFFIEKNEQNKDEPIIKSKFFNSSFDSNAVPSNNNTNTTPLSKNPLRNLFSSSSLLKKEPFIEISVNNNSSNKIFTLDSFSKQNQKKKLSKVDSSSSSDKNNFLFSSLHKESIEISQNFLSRNVNNEIRISQPFHKRKLDDSPPSHTNDNSKSNASSSVPVVSPFFQKKQQSEEDSENLNQIFLPKLSKKSKTNKLIYK